MTVFDIELRLEDEPKSCKMDSFLGCSAYTLELIVFPIERAERDI